MGRFAPFAILGIIIGVVSITSGVGVAAMGVAENANTPPASTERVCSEYADQPDMSDPENITLNNESDRPRSLSEAQNWTETEESNSTTERREIGEIPCEEYTTYTTGGGSPGNSKIAGGSVLALLGGTIVYRSTR